MRIDEKTGWLSVVYYDNNLEEIIKEVQQALEDRGIDLTTCVWSCSDVRIPSGDLLYGELFVVYSNQYNPERNR